MNTLRIISYVILIRFHCTVFKEDIKRENIYFGVVIFYGHTYDATEWHNFNYVLDNNLTFCMKRVVLLHSNMTYIH